MGLDHQKTKDKNSDDKEGLRKRVGDKRIEIQKVSMYNQNGDLSDTFVSGEDATIRIALTVNEEINNPTIGILIRDRLGNDVFGTNTYYLNKNFGILKAKSSYIIEYFVKLDVGCNIYTLTVASHSSYTHVEECYDWINEIVTFKVVPDADYTFAGAARLLPTVKIESAM